MYQFSVLAGLCFGIWPLIMKRSGLNPQLAAVMLALLTLLTCLPFLSRANASPSEFWKLGAIFAVAAGLINGVGQIFLQRLIGAAERADVSQALIIVVLAQIATTAIGGRLFYGDPFTLKKGAGIILALIAAKLLTGT